MERKRPSLFNVPFGNPGQAGGASMDPYLYDRPNQNEHSSSSDRDRDENPQVPYSRGVHSIHRHRNISSQSNLMKIYEARVGGNGAKSIARYRREMSHYDDFMDRHADFIVEKMEQDPFLMEDTPISEDLRKQTLRDMPQCLTLKRQVKVKLQKSVSRKSKRKPLSWWKQFKYRTSIAVSKFKLGLKNIIYLLELWYDALKHIEGNFGSEIGSFFKFLRLIFIMNLFVFFVSFVFIVLPQILADNEKRDNITYVAFDWKDIFTGSGSFENSLLYYGFYSSSTFSFNSMSYSMPHAYFFTMVFIFLSYVVFFSCSAASSYRKSFIETEGGLKNVFAHKVFCSWDYSIATTDAAELKSNAIYNELRELLYEDMKVKRKQSCMNVFYTVTIQILVNLLVILSLIGAGYLMWYLMDRSYQNDWTPIYAALSANTIMTVYPIIFSWIVKYEDYESPKVNLYLSLVRTFTLGFVTIGVLMSFWLKDSDGQIWETSLAQEIYRMIIFDFLFAVIVSPFIDILSYCFLRCYAKDHLHFDIAKYTMQIIYNQCLYWVGLMFSPLLPAVITIKLFIVWYVRQFILLKFCKPSSKTWRAAQTTAWFLMMTLLGCLLVLGLLGYVITNIPATKQGPFSEYEYIYEIVTVGLLNLKSNSLIFDILLYTTKPGFIALVLIALCCRVYYIRAKAHALRGVVKIYREMLLWEAKDKEFLLEKLSDLSNGKWQYKLQEGRLLDPISSAPTIPTDKTDEDLTSIQGDSNYELLKSVPSTSVIDPVTSNSESGHYSEYKKLS